MTEMANWPPDVENDSTRISTPTLIVESRLVEILVRNWLMVTILFQSVCLFMFPNGNYSTAYSRLAT